LENPLRSLALAKTFDFVGGFYGTPKMPLGKFWGCWRTKFFKDDYWYALACIHTGMAKADKAKSNISQPQ
jgi:hypothetical protein